MSGMTLPTRAEVWPRIRLVESPRPEAQVFHDLADESTPFGMTRVMRNGFDPGKVELLGDPDSVGAEWGLRTINIMQAIYGTKQGAYARMQSLNRAVFRRRFWVMVQWTRNTAPVWWHAYLTPPEELSFDNVYALDDQLVPDQWVIKLAIVVDPFAYAARVIHTPKVVGNNPATSGVPAFGYALPTIRGDVATRLRVKITPSTTVRNAQRWLVACVSSDRPDPVIQTPLGVGDGYTPTTSPGTSGSDTDNVALIGGTGRRVSEAIGREISGAFPAPGAPAGQYQVWVRLAAVPVGSNAFNESSKRDSVVSVQMRSPSGVPLAPTAVARFLLPLNPNGDSGATTTPNSSPQWVPLGVIGIGDGLPDDVSTGLARRSMKLVFSGDDATADHMMFVPVTGRGVTSTSTLIIRATGSAAAVGPVASSPLMVDGDTEADWLGGSVDADYALANDGGYPQVDPAAPYNVLLVMPISADTIRNQSETDRATAIGQTSQVVTSYLPRSVWFGDGS